MLGMPFHGGVDTFQGMLASYVLIAVRILPCNINVAPALLEQAFDMRISMQAHCKTRLHDAPVTHIYRQTKGIRKQQKTYIGLISAGRPPGPIVALCIGHAFSGLQNLYFYGDVLRFQSDFLAVKRELDTTRAVVTHLIMCQLMKAFDGKSKSVQFKIADDFNKMDVDHDDPDINLYDLVQGYCADLATVGDSKSHAVGVVVCSVCQSGAYESAECPTRKQLAREINEANRAKKLSGGAPGRKPRKTNPSHAHLTCHPCHEFSHIPPNCPEKALPAAQSHVQVRAAQAPPTPYAPVGNNRVLHDRTCTSFIDGAMATSIEPFTCRIQYSHTRSNKYPQLNPGFSVAVT